MKKLYNSLIVIFTGLITIFGVLTFALPEKTYSEIENRYLQTLPSVTISGIISSDTQSELIDYMSDQFPARDFFTAAETAFKKLIGKKDSGGVYIGRDGYYFEKLSDSDINYELYEKNLGRIENFAQQYPEIPVSVMLVPSAGTVISNKLPSFAELYDADKMYEEAVNTLKNCDFLDLRNALSGASDSYTYYKTDHHWTSRGAYIGCSAFLESRGMCALSYDHVGFVTVTSEFFGTLYSKALDSDAEPDSISIAPVSSNVTVTADGERIGIYDMSALSEKDKYQVFFGGNYGEVDISGGCGNGKTLLIIKDSFADCFAPLLIGDYENIIMIDLRYFSGSVSNVAENMSVDEVLFLYEMSNFANDSNFVKLLMN